MQVKVTMSTPEIEISNSAKVCYASTGDKDILPGLMKRNHLSVLRFAYCTFNIKDISIPCHVQMLRSANISFLVQSKRYCNINKGDFKFIYPTNITQQQRDMMRIHWEESVELYNTLLNDGVKKEDARAVLPTNTSTELNATANLQGWYDFCRLRINSHAQDEIRELAIKIFGELQELYPQVFTDELFNEFRKG
jgi:thymidylate synthase (FAD)